MALVIGVSFAVGMTFFMTNLLFSKAYNSVVIIYISHYF